MRSLQRSYPAFFKHASSLGEKSLSIYTSTIPCEMKALNTRTSAEKLTHNCDQAQIRRSEFNVLNDISDELGL